MTGWFKIDCMVGVSADRRVLMGFAPACLLHAVSFADVLNEDTGAGYQRRFDAQHSQDFRRFIRQPTASTIPLTLNLRPTDVEAWRLVELGGACVRLEINPDAGKVMAQVDCQHRLGHLDDLDISLPFMCFLGLSVREEMEVFNTINGKAKGLSTSLLDFHDAQLSGDLANDRPELFIALHLNNDGESPWCRQLDLGGNCTSGLNRRASLRTMQKAIKRFLTASRILKSQSPERAAQVVMAFWRAVAEVLPEQWTNSRKHVLNKGVGVYALMNIAADLYSEAENATRVDRRYFVNALSDFAGQVDWSTDGPLKGLGGEGGVRSAVDHVRDVRRRARLKVVRNG
ncbi:DGQHR domain-containing protein [Methylosinus sporium]|uniref:DGQHR domain-containing protein n=1 Tax=Methylosinus sporium TaxID=428 RepID=A0A549T5S9_METSR|nr:DGQHR domain-containing protein [Methylosinus sporium]TRL37180.1 DGQHR domain-containing protein [Methylosinus sporium]